MRYCVDGRSSIATIKKADEIKLELKDWDIMYDFVIDYPDKDIIISIPRVATWIDIPFNSFTQLEKKPILEFNSYYEKDKPFFKACQDNGIKFYLRKSICTWYELKCALALGVSQIFIGAPLFFSITDVKKFIGDDVDIRIHPNYIPEGCLGDSIHNAWIRPEDIGLYKEIITTLDFSDEKEMAASSLITVYKKEKWEGNLALLIANFNYHIDNRIVPQEFGKLRLNCKQKCMDPTRGFSVCGFCENAIAYCEKVREEYYKNDGKLPNTPDFD